MRDYLDCHFITPKSRVDQRFLKSTFDHFQIINENLVIVYEKQREICLKSPIQIGYTVLEYAKHVMYNGFYLDIKPRFKSVQMLMSDTDSWILSLVQKDEDKDRKCVEIIRDLMDFSNYDSNDPLYTKDRQSQLGYLKDECGGKQLTEFCGLRPKSYSYKTETGFTDSRLKGITRGYRKTLSHEAYKECVFQNRSQSVKQVQIRAKNHHIKTVSLMKTALSGLDDKKWLHQCGVHCSPYGSVYAKPECLHCSRKINK
ncbi:MAG: hypothetical protein MI810_09110 [Flavobacteriales bacterium]|nr:hypothetical protein [Flavobacteriales bacterium]